MILSRQACACVTFYITKMLGRISKSQGLGGFFLLFI
ncbi:hypothetical protein PAND9192_03218 [Photobacterium andalusiense]|uniref:Uncharacterized protein n=1 Tax=Photobacterium andalusiense TaxID=2204296 RepID=A0A1Y6MM50_9GAMM|nr:hypothetical protein PAND9192_03218 [Photobacterium andalusiense]